MPVCCSDPEAAWAGELLAVEEQPRGLAKGDEPPQLSQTGLGVAGMLRRIGAHSLPCCAAHGQSAGRAQSVHVKAPRKGFALHPCSAV